MNSNDPDQRKACNENDELNSSVSDENDIPELDSAASVQSTGTLDGMLEWGEMPGIPSGD